jgi:hypothetical protein
MKTDFSNWHINLYGPSQKEPQRIDIGPIGYNDGLIQIPVYPGMSDLERRELAETILDALRKYSPSQCQKQTGE